MGYWPVHARSSHHAHQTHDAHGQKVLTQPVHAGSLRRPAGIGFRGELSHAADSLASILRRLLAIRNCTSALFPPGDRVFVREGWQNPLLPERNPKLERTWDLYWS